MVKEYYITVTSDHNEEALAGAATTLSLLSPLLATQLARTLARVSKMKCYYHHTHHCFLDYFNDLIPDDVVIFASDMPFQYSKIEDGQTAFIGSPMGEYDCLEIIDFGFFQLQNGVVDLKGLTCNNFYFGRE